MLVHADKSPSRARVASWAPAPRVGWVAFGEAADIQLPLLLTDAVKQELEGRSWQEVLEEIRKNSQTFSKGVSAYRGVKAKGRFNFPITDYARNTGPGPHATEESSKVFTATLAAGKLHAEAEAAAIAVALASGGSSLVAAAGAAGLLPGPTAATNSAGTKPKAACPAAKQGQGKQHQEQHRAVPHESAAGTGAAAGGMVAGARFPHSSPAGEPEPEVAGAGIIAAFHDEGGEQAAATAGSGGVRLESSTGSDTEGLGQGSEEEGAASYPHLTYGQATGTCRVAWTADWEQQQEPSNGGLRALNSCAGAEVSSGASTGSWDAGAWAPKEDQEEAYHPEEYTDSDDEWEEEEYLAWLREQGVSEEAITQLEEGDEGAAVCQELEALQAIQARGPSPMAAAADFLRKAQEERDKQQPRKPGDRVLLQDVEDYIKQELRRSRQEVRAPGLGTPDGSSPDLEACRQHYRQEKVVFHDRLASLTDPEVRDQYIVDMGKLARQFGEPDPLHIITPGPQEAEAARWQAEELAQELGLPDVYSLPELKHWMGPIFEDYSSQPLLAEVPAHLLQQANEKVSGVARALQHYSIHAQAQQQQLYQQQQGQAGSTARDPTAVLAAGEGAVGFKSGVPPFKSAGAGATTSSAVVSDMEIDVQLGQLEGLSTQALERLAALKASTSAADMGQSRKRAEWEERAMQALQAGNTTWLERVLGPEWPVVVGEHPLFGPHRPPPSVPDPYLAVSCGKVPTGKQMEQTWDTMMSSQIPTALEWAWRFHGAGMLPSAATVPPGLPQQVGFTKALQWL
ncbi:hypothetical protein N2152v2_003528 [Parachlorella kessleri]